jgi:hypothetical protein
MNREAWLTAGVQAITPMFKEHGYTVPDKIRVSCGWPSIKALGRASRRIGECWSTRNSGDSTWEMFITPGLADPVRVLGVLVHEIVHAVVGLECGHRGAFRTCATKLGLEGKMTATTESAELVKRLNAIIEKLGPYPHAVLKGSGKEAKPQGTRLLKVMCNSCGYTVRITNKWIDRGLPVCPCGCEMEEAADE